MGPGKFGLKSGGGLTKAMKGKTMKNRRRAQRPPRVANYGQRRQIETLMLENSKMAPDGRHRLWEAGWSYKRCAQEVSPIFDGGHAQRIARSLNIRFMPTTVPTDEVFGAMDEFNKRLHVLEELVLRAKGGRRSPPQRLPAEAA